MKNSQHCCEKLVGQIIYLLWQEPKAMKLENFILGYVLKISIRHVSSIGKWIYSMLFERTMLSDKKNELFISKNKSLSCLRDNYVLEFLNLPENHKEKDLRKSIVLNIKDFILGIR